ncbi:hypothetical protein J437_LFUL011135 [Ladona fulva]|uniref:Transposase n=1 Tax=Ladona fulva TaxID=123851 RepID=A0A8K0K846_LADFU|nr:hypothetical protein J437_LFUL011135 [Ladona fulva]
MRITRKEVPNDLRQKKLKKGRFAAFQRGKVMVMKWHDKKATWNSFVLYRKSGGTKSNLDFRMELVENIIERYHTENMRSKGGRPSDEPHTLWLTERHFPEYVHSTNREEGKAM